MKALVTGAAGFIGSHLVDTLLAKGHTVVALDNFNNGTGEHEKKGKVRSQIKFVRANIALRNSLKNDYFAGIDWIFHLAAKSPQGSPAKDLFEYHKVNMVGTLNLLEIARKIKIKKFIYASTASVYGIPDDVPTPESTPMRLDTPYALTKYAAEEYAVHWGMVYKVPVISLRMFNVYGPKIRKSGSVGPILSLFIRQKLDGKPYTVVGDGRQKRDFVYVGDVADAFIKSAKSPVTNDIFNVGSGKPESINTLVKLLDGKFVYVPKKKPEPKYTWADIRKIKKIIGWEPRVFLKEGIPLVLDSLKHWKSL